MQGNTSLFEGEIRQSWASQRLLTISLQRHCAGRAEHSRWKQQQIGCQRQLHLDRSIQQLWCISGHFVSSTKCLKCLFQTLERGIIAPQFPAKFMLLRLIPRHSLVAPLSVSLLSVCYHPRCPSHLLIRIRLITYLYEWKSPSKTREHLLC